MNKKQGFTLIELLAVIVILAIILAIAVPGITGIIKNSTKNAFESDAKMVIQQLKYKKIEDDSFNVTSIDENNITSLNLSNANYDKLSAGMVDNNLYIVIIGKNKWAGLKACGTREAMKVVDASDTTTCQNIAVATPNTPVLATGMTPIKWDGSSWVNTTSSDTNWYNYDTTTKQWANAKTADGSMWVWIPRFIYRISSGWHSNATGTIDIQFSKGTDDNWNSGSIGNINTDTTANASNNKWTNEPAFDLGSNKLTGMWVAKFEASAAEGVDNDISLDNVTTKTVKILPNAISWRNIEVGNVFTVSRDMETNSTYGWGTSGTGIDTHLMKNTEWGAVAYLSKSNYGQGENKIWINPANNFTTGCSGTSATSTQTTGCTNTYDSSNGVHASTTGNIYGIYDMNGSATEYVAAYVNNDDPNLSNFGASIVSATTQYKDIYNTATDQSAIYSSAISKKGDAIYETSNSTASPYNYSWFQGYSYMPYADGPWFIRGGGYSSGSGASVFDFSSSNGGTLGGVSFRPIIMVNASL